MAFENRLTRPSRPSGLPRFTQGCAGCCAMGGAARTDPWLGSWPCSCSKKLFSRLFFYKGIWSTTRLFSSRNDSWLGSWSCLLAPARGCFPDPWHVGLDLPPLSPVEPQEV